MPVIGTDFRMFTPIVTQGKGLSAASAAVVPFNRGGEDVGEDKEVGGGD